ncbi:MAG TPA: DNA-directed RNA polymerase subunit beta' [Clostridiales bacterium]|nr:DNA-directed RNA polymerase subunit beta' [Clostridiales bacterium]
MLNEENYNELDFEAIQIGLASPEDIAKWSHGEVKEPETINYKSQKPEPNGLFCEAIFGPVKDYECHCGKYKKGRVYAGQICDKCHTEITSSKVRRDRMGHIELACPVAHLWYVKGTPSRIATILNISNKNLEEVIHYNAYIVLHLGENVVEYDRRGDEIKVGTVINQKSYDQCKMKHGKDFIAQKGAPAIQTLLKRIDVDAECEALRDLIMGTTSGKPATGQNREKLLKRYEVFNDFRESGNKPEWMILEKLPVIPPDLRPMVALDGGRYAASDLNELYRHVISRNNRLKKLIELGSASIVLDNECRMLQEAVNALIDNTKRQNKRPVTGANNRPLKSLTDLLKGKQGRFRQNLLGKRVDFSGRSVIVVGPELKIYQCGLPKEMALELFKPFVMKWLMQNGKSTNEKAAKREVDNAHPKVWDGLEVVIKDHPVMLNRAPTLHRLSIQAFEPVLVEGRAIKLHPLVCTAFNADFDGDQMAVHVPLSHEAQSEARNLMLASNNLLKPSDGRSATVPTQDMVLGSYYLTMVNPVDENKPQKFFSSEDEAVMAHEQGELDIHDVINVRRFAEIDGVMCDKIIKTTLGKIIFNRNIPQNLGFVDRNNPENAFDLEVDFLVSKKLLGQIIDRSITINGTKITSKMLDDIKSLGFRYSTLSGITIAISDAIIPPQKKEYIAEAEEKIAEIDKGYQRGKFSDADRKKATIQIWEETTKRIMKVVPQNLAPDNPIAIMVNSGARGSEIQLNQLAGMRGLIANTAGETIEIPIRANFREGLTVLEYFSSSRGARKGLADTALRTADSGYLTRRLVDAAQDVIVRIDDCHCSKGITVCDLMNKAGDKVIESFKERLIGRFLLESLYDDNGNLIMSHEYIMNEEDAERIINAGFTSAVIRSPLTCECENGICVQCYGSDLATAKPINIGEAAGIFAAQSIGEPGTQLTMRTFHTGGVTTGSDITHGLPRVEELFEARTPNPQAILSEISGVVSFAQEKRRDIIRITGEEGVKSYPINYDTRVTVTEGQFIEKGTELTGGSPAPADILEISGLHAVQDYLIREVQSTYRGQGVDINDKHIEIIIRQLLLNVIITDPGDTRLISGVRVSKRELRELVKKARDRYIDANGSDEGFREPETKPVILGLTKASLAADSFLSAASFQEANRVLTEAAVKGKTDRLLGLKENVIVGRLLPAGTGMRIYNNIEVRGEDAAPVEY